MIEQSPFYTKLSNKSKRETTKQKTNNPNGRPRSYKKVQFNYTPDTIENIEKMLHDVIINTANREIDPRAGSVINKSLEILLKMKMPSKPIEGDAEQNVGSEDSFNFNEIVKIVRKMPLEFQEAFMNELKRELKKAKVSEIDESPKSNQNDGKVRVQERSPSP